MRGVLGFLKYPNQKARTFKLQGNFGDFQSDYKMWRYIVAVKAAILAFGPVEAATLNCYCMSSGSKGSLCYSAILRWFSVPVRKLPI